jgi:hypothetical protein
MSQIEKITAILNELSSKDSGRSCLDPESGWCVTFNFKKSSSEIKDHWIQIWTGLLNMSYNDDENPNTMIPKKVACFPQDVKFFDWNPSARSCDSLRCSFFR